MYITKSMHIYLYTHLIHTAWKLSVFKVFLVRIFPHLDWIRRNTSYFSIFSADGGKYRPEKLGHLHRDKETSKNGFVRAIKIS